MSFKFYPSLQSCSFSLSLLVSLFLPSLSLFLSLLWQWFHNGSRWSRWRYCAGGFCVYGGGSQWHNSYEWVVMGFWDLANSQVMTKMAIVEFLQWRHDDNAGLVVRAPSVSLGDGNFEALEIMISILGEIWWGFWWHNLRLHHNLYLWWDLAVSPTACDLLLRAPSMSLRTLSLI